MPVPVHILADELANIGEIPDLKKKISTVRSRDISMSVIFQNLAQMKNRYPDDQWQEILGNCDVQLFLGCTDQITAEFISKRTGEATVVITSVAKQLNSMRITNYTPEYRETSTVAKRSVLTPDEVLRLDLSKALVILHGQKILEVDKFDFSKHPETRKLKPTLVSEHIPNWFKHLDEPEPVFTNFIKANTNKIQKGAGKNSKLPSVSEKDKILEREAVKDRENISKIDTNKLHEKEDSPKITPEDLAINQEEVNKEIFEEEIIVLTDKDSIMS